jgi:hypothetical protein
VRGNLFSYLTGQVNNQIGVRLIGEAEARTVTVIRPHSDFVELSGLFGGEQNYIEGRMKKIRVPYSAIAWLE